MGIRSKIRRFLKTILVFCMVFVTGMAALASEGMLSTYSSFGNGSGKLTIIKRTDGDAPEYARYFDFEVTYEDNRGAELTKTVTVDSWDPDGTIIKFDSIKSIKEVSKVPDGYTVSTSYEQSKTSEYTLPLSFSPLSESGDWIGIRELSFELPDGCNSLNVRLPERGNIDLRPEYMSDLEAMENHLYHFKVSGAGIDGEMDITLTKDKREEEITGLVSGATYTFKTDTLGGLTYAYPWGNTWDESGYMSVNSALGIITIRKSYGEPNKDYSFLLSPSSDDESFLKPVSSVNTGSSDDIGDDACESTKAEYSKEEYIETIVNADDITENIYESSVSGNSIGKDSNNTNNDGDKVSDSDTHSTESADTDNIAEDDISNNHDEANVSEEGNIGHSDDEDSGSDDTDNTLDDSVDVDDGSMILSSPGGNAYSYFTIRTDENGYGEIKIKLPEDFNDAGLKIRQVGAGFHTATIRATENSHSELYPDEDGNVAISGGTLIVTNTYEKTEPKLGTLTVHKELEGNSVNTEDIFKFKVTLYKGDDIWEYNTGEGHDVPWTEHRAAFENGVTYIELKGGESKSIINLPIEIDGEKLSYTVEEIDDKDYEVTIPDNSSGTIVAGETDVTFINYKNVTPPPEEDYGNLKVTKTVTGNSGDTSKDWHFKVELSNKDITGTYGDMSFTNGITEFTLKHNESKTAKGIPAKTGYTVTEAEANTDGYTTTAQGNTGNIPKDNTATATFSNWKNNEKPNDPAYGNLQVTKTVTGTAGDTDKYWNFHIELSDTSINGAYGDITFVNGVADFTLKHGESKKATRLPIGINYKVTETEANKDGYTTNMQGNEGQIIDGETANALFVNSKDKTPPPDPEDPPTPSDPPSDPPNDPPSNPPSDPPTDIEDNGTPSTHISAPETSDFSSTPIWGLICAMSLCGVAVFWPYKKKAHESKER